MNEIHYPKWTREIWIIRPEDKVHFIMCPWFWLYKEKLNLFSPDSLIYVEWHWYQTIWNIKKKNISMSDCIIVRYDFLKKNIEELFNK